MHDVLGQVEESAPDCRRVFREPGSRAETREGEEGGHPIVGGPPSSGLGLAEGGEELGGCGGVQVALGELEGV